MRIQRKKEEEKPIELKIEKEKEPDTPNLEPAFQILKDQKEKILPVIHPLHRTEYFRL